jgi:hypothetical protein
MSIGPLTSSLPITPAISPPSTSTSSVRQWSSDPRIDEQNWADLERLTPSDRTLIKQATGQDIPTRVGGELDKASKYLAANPPTDQIDMNA